MPGKTSKAASTSKKILFVCTGNTCRSAMAGALARKVLEELGYGNGNIEITSAGLAAYPGDVASPGAVRAMREMGIDLAGHRSSLIDPAEVEEADLVLTMTSRHREMLCRMVPSCAGRVHTLAGYAGVPGDVPDPFGQSDEVYKHVAKRLDKLVRIALERYLGETGTGGE